MRTPIVILLALRMGAETLKVYLGWDGQYLTVDAESNPRFVQTSVLADGDQLGLGSALAEWPRSHSPTLAHDRPCPLIVGGGGK